MKPRIVPFGNRDDRHRVQSAEGDEQRAPVGRDDQRRRGNALERQAERPQRYRRRDALRVRVDDRDRVGVGIGDEQPVAWLVPGHRRRMQLDAQASCVTFRASRSMREMVPVDAMPRLSTTTRSASGAVPVGSVTSPSAGQRPPQLLTHAARPSRLITAPKGATPPVLTLPSRRPALAHRSPPARCRRPAAPPRGRCRRARSDGRSSGQVQTEIGGQRHERSRRRAGAAARRLRRDSRLRCAGTRHADERRLAYGVEHQALKCRRRRTASSCCEPGSRAIRAGTPAGARPCSARSSPTARRLVRRRRSRRRARRTPPARPRA